MNDGFMLSPQQQRLWRLGAGALHSPYRVRAEIRICGAVNGPALAAALDSVIAQHEILRTSFRLGAGMTEPVQCVAEPVRMSAGFAPALDIEAERVASADATIDGESASSFEVRVVALTQAECRLLITVSALCADIESIAIFARALHRALTTTAPNESDAVQYADYAQWQSDLIGAEEWASNRAFWRNQLYIADSVRSLPLSARAAPSQAFAPTELALCLAPETALALASAATSLGVSAQACLLAGWLSTLARITGCDRIAAGALLSLRQFDELADAIGPMSKVLPIALNIDPQASFHTLTSRLDEMLEHARQTGDSFAWNLLGDEEADSAHAPPYLAAGFDFAAMEVVNVSGVAVSVQRMTACLDRFQLHLSCMINEKGIVSITLRYDAGRFRTGDIAAYATIFTRLIEEAMHRPATPVGALGGPSENEIERLHSAVDQLTPQPSDGPGIHERISAMAQQIPERVAVVCEDERLSYAELDCLSNQWARALIEQGVGLERIVVVMADRSAFLPVFLLAILKAGAAYLPLDPNTPRARVDQIVEATGAGWLLSTGEQEDPPQSGEPGNKAATTAIRRIDVGDARADVAALSPLPLPRCATAGALAYVVMTSGSTGHPKGVAVEHRQLTHYADGATVRLGLDACDSFALVSSIAADLGYTMLYPSLLLGRRLVIAGAREMLDATALAKRFTAEGGIDGLKIAPSHLKALLDAASDSAAILPCRRLILGGEAFEFALAERLRKLVPACRLFNHYGPTETTVGALTVELPKNEWDYPSATVPIGFPLPGVVAFAADNALRPVADGCVGELCIAGAGLARGYQRAPELTATRFVSAAPLGPDGPSIRLYRTGDRVRRLPDGGFEFLGRRDRQVKLRGFRVELDEIDATARAHPFVAEAVALVRELAPGHHGLVLMFTAHGQCSANDLRRHLRERLPGHMQPQRLIRLGTMPLTRSGKIDHQALACRQLPAAEAEGYEAPRTALEARLAAIWQETIGLSRVGIHDDFFHLGGDSIIGIQIVSLAREAGLRLTVHDLFERRTIAALAAVARRPEKILAEQGAVTGEIPLTPIQHWFFQSTPPSPSHWTMALLVESEPELDVTLLEHALDDTIRHHDVLRVFFEQRAGRMVQVNAAAVERLLVEVADLGAIPVEEHAAMIEAHASRVQTSLDLARPPLLRVKVFRRGKSRTTRILFVAHHLIMDSVSWRLFIETIHRAYAARQAGQPVTLPAKTSSYRQWSKALSAYACSDSPRAHAAFWKEMATGISVPLPIDLPDGTNTIGRSAVVEAVLDPDTTRALLRDVPVAYQTRINDALLTALGRTLCDFTGSGAIRLELEGHGRELLLPGIDCSRTLGWFTARWPQVLRLEGDDIGADLRSVKEQLRRVPDGGIGYGVLRYLAPTSEVAAPLADTPDPEVGFNYLGQIDQTVAASGWGFASEPTGMERAADGKRRQLISIDAVTTGGELRMRWTYATEFFHRRTVERLAQRCLNELRAIVGHCTLERCGSYTPSDFPLARLTQAQLDDLSTRYARVDPNRLSTLQQLLKMHYLLDDYREDQHQQMLRKMAIEDVYPLSPMQQGLLFDILYAEDPSLYMTQKTFVFEGTLDAQTLQAAWAKVMARHASLRTVFVLDGLDEPVQVVLSHVDIPWRTLDWSTLVETDRDAALDACLARDWSPPLDFARPPLMRFSLARLQPDRHLLIWTHHHLMLDGWCNSVLLRELFDHVAAMQENRSFYPPQPGLYRDYIRWLSSRPPHNDESYWRAVLRDVRIPTPLRFAGNADARARRCDQFSLTLDAAETRALHELAQRCGFTVAAILHAAWALMLSRASGERDVVFGITVAARPAELPNVEATVGLMINVLPLRVRVAPDQVVVNWIREAHDAQVELLNHQYAALAQVRNWAGVAPGQPLFESHLTFENYPVDGDVLVPSKPLRVAAVRSIYRTALPLSITVEPHEAMTIDVTYHEARFERESLIEMMTGWRDLLAALPAMCNQPVSAVRVCGPGAQAGAGTVTVTDVEV